MNSKILQTVEKYSLIDNGGKIIVALSGGADSVCLLDFLISIKEKYNLTIFAAHLNHNLRGAEAERDESFCKILCKNYNVKLFVKSSDIKALAESRKISEELCGRNERYAFFGELSARYGAKVATAHTASDNAETLIFNIARGASLGGVSAIAPKRGNIIRPLIELTRSEVEQYCASRKLSYVTDSTNLSDDYTRNRIRHNIIPLLKSVNPSFEKSALNLSESAREALEFLDRAAHSAEKLCKTEFGYDCKALLSLDGAVLKRFLLIHLKNNYNISLEQRHIALLCDIIKNGGSVELSKNYTAVSRQGVFRIVKASVQNSFTEIKLEKDLSFIYNGKQYSVNELSGKLNNNAVSSVFLNENAVFRTRRAGDTFTFAKRRVTKPLRKALNELKIPCEQRDSLLVLALDSNVLWCEKIGVSLYGQPKSPDKALQINIKGV